MQVSEIYGGRPKSGHITFSEDRKEEKKKSTAADQSSSTQQRGGGSSTSERWMAWKYLSEHVVTDIAMGALVSASDGSVESKRDSMWCNCSLSCWDPVANRYVSVDQFSVCLGSSNTLVVSQSVIGQEWRLSWSQPYFVHPDELTKKTMPVYFFFCFFCCAFSKSFEKINKLNKKKGEHFLDAVLGFFLKYTRLCNVCVVISFQKKIELMGGLERQE